MRVRSYSELRLLSTFEERFQYLSLAGLVGEQTFGAERFLNQGLYHSRAWRQLRPWVITRDNGCDLGIDGYDIYDRIYIHHMNPIQVAQLVDFDPDVLNPEFLISVTHETHNAIHYGDPNHLPRQFVDRQPGDTQLW